MEEKLKKVLSLLREAYTLIVEVYRNRLWHEYKVDTYPKEK